MSVRGLVKRLPYPIKQGLKYAYGALPPRIRYEKAFWETYNFLQESQWWSREKLEAYQIQQLGKLLHHVYENVPYYKRVFNERGLKPEHIQDLDDLRKLPYLTKEIVRKNLSELVARNYPKRRLQQVYTGGTTGTPMQLFAERHTSDAVEWAFIVTLWERTGYRLGAKCARLRNDIIRPTGRRKFWEYDPLNRVLVLSSYHMSEEYLLDYAERLRKFRPAFLHGFPSTISLLARFFREKGIPPFPFVKGVFCGSEQLYEWQRRLLEEVFQCRVYTWYGHAERAALAGECEKSTKYHIVPQYGIVELIDEHDSPVSKDNEVGEIVATGLNTWAMPLIRYRTDDLAVSSKPNTKCTCGREHPLLLEVVGRAQSLFVSRSGSLLTAQGSYSLVAKTLENVIDAQFYQEEKGKVVLSLVKRDRNSDVATNKLHAAFRRRYRDQLSLEVCFVESISRSRQRKAPLLIQKLPIEFGSDVRSR